MIRVLVADDQALVRHGFSMILRAERDIEVVGEAADGREAVSLAVAVAPDVVLMDVRMPELGGIEATREILRIADGTRVLVLTTFDDEEIVVGALRAGASGFLLKDAPHDQLTAAIRVVSMGGSLFAPSATRLLIERYADVAIAGVDWIDDLTARELEIVRFVGRGMSNAEIATELIVSEHTVKTHVGNILRKLDLRDRTQLVVLAYESGILRRGEP